MAPLALNLKCRSLPIHWSEYIREAVCELDIFCVSAVSSDPAGNEMPINPGDLKISSSVEEEQHELDSHQGDSTLTSKDSVEETLYDKEIVDQEVPAPEVSKKSGELAGERATTEDAHVGGRRRRPGSKGRLSYDLDIPTGKASTSF